MALLTDTELVSGPITLPDGVTLTLSLTPSLRQGYGGQAKTAIIPISQSGSTLNLHFATKRQLQALTLTPATKRRQQLSPPS
jgi:hypothetical protein